MFCLTRGNSVPANRSSNPLSSFIKCNLPCVIELSNAGESRGRGGGEGHWAGQRGHAALTRRIRGELRDWSGRWFWDNINPAHHFLVLLSMEDIGADVMKTVAALKKKCFSCKRYLFYFVKMNKHCCNTFFFLFFHHVSQTVTASRAKLSPRDLLLLKALTQFSAPEPVA